MKLTLTTEHRADLNSLREQLADILDENSAAGKKLEDATARHAQLSGEIATLEASGSDSEKAASALVTKRTQLEQLERKISDLQGSSIQLNTENLDGALSVLRQFSQAATLACNSAVETYALEVTASLRPYCQDDKQARGFAFTVPAVKWLATTYSTRFGDMGFSLSNLKAAIARCDEILSGQLNWTWDAKMTNASK